MIVESVVTDIDEIVRRVERLFAFADRLEARCQAGADRVARLTPVLLTNSFRGELVAQDPNDEPTSVPLERIRGEWSTNRKQIRNYQECS